MKYIILFLITLYSAAGYANCYNPYTESEVPPGTRVGESICQSDGKWLYYPKWQVIEDDRRADEWCRRNRDICRELSWWENLSKEIGWEIPIEDNDENNMPNVLF